MTERIYKMWKEGRTRLNHALEGIEGKDLKKRLAEDANSIGFLMEHLAEVELLFAKNIFGDQSIKIKAQTIIDGRDSGEWTDFESINDLLNKAEKKLGEVIKSQSNDIWDEEVTTKEFGTKSKAEAFARVITHTAYHAGQIAMIKKYGN